MAMNIDGKISQFNGRELADKEARVEIESLRTLLNEARTNISILQNRQVEWDKVNGKPALLSETEKIALKADVSNELAKVNEKIENILGKLDNISNLLNDNDVLESFKEINDAVKKINDEIKNLSENKLNSSEFSSLSTKVDTIENNLTTVEEELNNKLTEKADALDSKISLIKTEVENNRYNITFEGIENCKLTVYKKCTKEELFIDSNILQSDEVITARNGDTGDILSNGEGQLNFKLVPNSKYRITKISIDGNYKNLKTTKTEETYPENCYRITKIASDIVISVATKGINDSDYTATFEGDHYTVKIYTDDTFTEEAEISGSTYTLPADKLSFEIIPDFGYSYTLVKGNITGSINKLKDEGTNRFSITKITSNITISPILILVEKSLADYGINNAYTKEETDGRISSKISDLVNGAPEQLDTLKELADAMSQNKDALDAIEATFNSKLDTIKVPTKTSELTNDSGFLTEHQLLDGYVTQDALEEVEGKIPTKVSQLTNDSGFLTQHQSLADYATKTEVEGVSNRVTALENSTTGGSSIDDENISLDKTYSSQKISDTYLPLSGGTLTGRLTAPELVIPVDNITADYKSRDSKKLEFHIKDNDGIEWPASIYVDSYGQLRFGSTGGTLAELGGTVATQSYVKKRGFFKYDYEVDNKVALEGLSFTESDKGIVVYVKDPGMCVAWTGTKFIDFAPTYDLSTYALKTELPTKTSQLTNDSGFLTEHQSLDGYATKENLQEVKNKISNVEGIPAAPAEDGTYTLKVVVSSGVPTYSWVKE